VNELKDSTWNYFNSDSVLVMSEQYVKGELNGLTKTYYYEGKLYEVKSWVNNVADGKLVQYFMDGSIKMESTFSMGKRDGKQLFYHSNGNVYYTGFYLNDLKSGIWEYFTEEGIQDTIINYNE
jgi:antitoxin component YwqK of YwqJK toxin-antitoxin module